MPVRTIAIKVAEVLEGGTKGQFYADLRKTLDLSVRIANVAITECARQDDLSADKPPKIYTYPALVKAGMTAGVSQAVSNIARSVEKSYKQDRWHVARGKKSLRCYRSQPWPLLSNASSNTLQLSASQEFLSARIKLMGGWWTVRLAGGSNYRDQIKSLSVAIENGTYGDSKIWTDRKHKAIIGIACDIPTAERKTLHGAMSISSSRDSLLVGTFERSDVPFVINADVVHTWQSEANTRYQRLRQDRKSDADRRAIRREMNDISAKMNRRMSTLCHDVSSRIINKAIRAGVAEIKLDLTIKSYARLFPWFDLTGKIKYKAESAGIRVVDATQGIAEPDIEKPHVYFKYAPTTNRIKIGMTGREDGGRHGTETDSPEELTILAVDNQPKAKLRAREKHFHAMFQEHRLTKQLGGKTEWFSAEPVLAWLREVEWLGNAGNLSQIAQVLDVSSDTIPGGHLKANSECQAQSTMAGCSHKAVKKRGYSDENQTALAVNE